MIVDSALPCFTDTILSLLTYADTPPEYMLVIYNKPISCKGTLNAVSFYALGDGTWYLDIYYISGSYDYKYLRSKNEVTSTGVGVQTYNFTSTISVEENDVFGIHYYRSSSTPLIPYASSTASSLSSTGYAATDLVGYVEKYYSDVSVDSSFYTSSSWTTSELRLPAVRLHITEGIVREFFFMFTCSKG